MKVTINLANKDSSIEQLTLFKDKKYAPFYINIINSHIKGAGSKKGENASLRSSFTRSNIQSI